MCNRSCVTMKCRCCRTPRRCDAFSIPVAAAAKQQACSRSKTQKSPSTAAAHTAPCSSCNTRVPQRRSLLCTTHTFHTFHTHHTQQCLLVSTSVPIPMSTSCHSTAQPSNIDPALLSIWRQMAADAASLSTPLAAVMQDSMKVTRACGCLGPWQLLVAVSPHARGLTCDL